MNFTNQTQPKPADMKAGSAAFTVGNAPPPATPAVAAVPQALDDFTGPPASAQRVVAGIILRGPFQVGRMQLGSIRIGQEGVAEVRIDAEHQRVWARRDLGATEAWGSTPFSNVIGVDYGVRVKVTA